MTLVKLHYAHVEWLGVRSSLSGVERKSFARWVAKNRPEIMAGYRGQPALFHLQCREIRRGGMSKSKGLGSAAMERHAVALTQRYLALPEKERGTFAEFLERVARDCSTEAQLRLFLDS